MPTYPDPRYDWSHLNAMAKSPLKACRHCVRFHVSDKRNAKGDRLGLCAGPPLPQWCVPMHIVEESYGQECGAFEAVKHGGAR
jgi:hypothetical protein